MACRLSLPILVALLFSSILSAHGQAEAAGRAGSSLATMANSLSVNTTTFWQIVINAIRHLLEAPWRLFKHLFAEVQSFLSSHQLRELYDFKTLSLLMSRVPKRLFAYWDALVGMESRCLERTVCDIAEYASRRVPKWFEQIAFIYFNTFAGQKPLYQVVVHGMTVKNCPLMYSECNPEEFLTRLRGNLSNSIATTVAPFKAALSQLADEPVSNEPNEISNFGPESANSAGNENENEIEPESDDRAQRTGRLMTEDEESPEPVRQPQQRHRQHASHPAASMRRPTNADAEADTFENNFAGSQHGLPSGVRHRPPHPASWPTGN